MVAHSSVRDVVAGRIDLALSAEAVPPTLESEVVFNLDFVCLVGSTQPVRKRRFHTQAISAAPARAGRNSGWSANHGGSSSGAAWREAARRTTHSVLFAHDLRHRQNRSGPDGPSQVGQGHGSDRWSARRGTAARYQSFSILHGVAFASQHGAGARMVA